MVPMPQQEEEVVEEGRGVASDTAAARLRHRARRLAAALDPRAPRHVDEAPSWEEDLRDSVEVPLPTEGDRTSWAVVARTWLAYSGPGLLISVGYMDPGNWSTNLSGGSSYGYDLLFIIWLANVIGCVLQALAVRLGVAGGVDLATAVRRNYHPWVSRFLWLVTEAAVSSTDLAEVLGSAIAFYILFGLPLWAGVLLTASDVLLLLTLQGRRTRVIEAVVLALIVVITGSLVFTLVVANAPAAEVALGLLPRGRIFTNKGELFNAVAILGATVMPHNLFLHSALMQSRNFEKSTRGRRQAIAYGVADTVAVLALATFVNAAILIVAAATFPGQNVSDLVQASSLLTPALGGAASKLFAVGLLASGQQATLTCTIAGQVVLEGFLGPGAALKPWARRLSTRSAAVIPALLVAVFSGTAGTAYLLNLSQVIQSLALPFCTWPLVHFASSRALLGDLAAPRWLAAAGALCFLLITGLNAFLVYNFAINASAAS